MTPVVENEFPYHYFIKTWYDGRGYAGSQVQPGLPTVDGFIVSGLQELGYLPRGRHNDHFKVAGRTDKGVSARAAVYYVNTSKPFHPGELNSWLLAGGQDILVWSVARLPGFVNPRDALHRTYRYYLHLDRLDLDVENVRVALRVLTGRHDFTGFSKAGIKEGIPTVRDMFQATCDVHGQVAIFTFKSQGFLWEQVRRMVGFIVANRGAPDLADRVRRVLESRRRPNVEPAPAENLVLWDVDYGDSIKWENLDDCLQQVEKVLGQRTMEMELQAFWYRQALDALGS